MADKPKFTFSKEADVKKHVKKLLDKHRWFWWMPAANGYGQQGVADICCLRGGVFMAVETKFGSNKPSAQQLVFLRAVTLQTSFAFVVNDQNIGWFDVFLQAFDKAAMAEAEKREIASEDGAAMIDAIRALTYLIPPVVSPDTPDTKQ